MDYVHPDDGRRLTAEEEAAIEDAVLTDPDDPALNVAGAMTPSVAQQAQDARAWPTLADVMGQPQVPQLRGDIPSRMEMARRLAEIHATVDALQTWVTAVQSTVDQLRRRVAVLERPDDPAAAVVAEFEDQEPG